MKVKHMRIRALVEMELDRYVPIEYPDDEIIVEGTTRDWWEMEFFESLKEGDAYSVERFDCEVIEDG